MINRYELDRAAEYAARYPDAAPELGMRVYTSRLLGAESSLVLHGGGNTSIKMTVPDLWGSPREVMYVKASGSDLADIGPEGFTALELAPLKKLKTLRDLPDLEAINQLAVNKIKAEAPAPSVDAFAHAFLPHRYVDHTHADAILVLTNQADPKSLLAEALGPRAVVIPYAHPGFPLGLGVAEAFENRPDCEAVIILGHGLFTFGEDAETAYTRMIDYVTRAEDFIALKTAGRPQPTTPAPPEPAEAARLAETVRGAAAHKVLGQGLKRFYVDLRCTPENVAASRAPEAAVICASGILTPDHAIRTKNEYVYLEKLPDDDQALKEYVQAQVAEYTSRYEEYFHKYAARGGVADMLDPFPRVFVAAGLGLAALGATPKEARTAADIAEHTIIAKLQAAAVGEYQPLDEELVFDMEYWGPQLKKLASRPAGHLAGQAALVTGAGGAIGYGVADRILAAGGAVALADIEAKRLEKVKSILAERHGADRVLALAFDVTDLASVRQAFERAALTFGGLDLIVPNAGLAHVATIEDLEPERLDAVMAVNYKGTFNVIKAAIPIFRRQGTGGHIVIISSKNVFAPGASFGAYSASKAAAHQIGRIAALELAGLGVKVNMVNPDAVFGDEKVSSGLWDLIGPDRMKSRGLDPEGLKDYYRKRNLLQAEVTAEHVGNAVVFFAADLTPTTGAVMPVDGGVPEAFPR